MSQFEQVVLVEDWKKKRKCDSRSEKTEDYGRTESERIEQVGGEPGKKKPSADFVGHPRDEGQRDVAKQR